MVAGLQPVREAVLAHGRAVTRVSVEHGDNPRLEALIRFASDHEVAEVTREPRALLDALTEGTVHQGVVAWAPELELLDFADLLAGPALLASCWTASPTRRTSARWCVARSGSRALP